LLNLEEDVPAEGSGGGICFDPSDSGTLLIRDSRIFGNFTTGYGGGIYAPAGAIEIINTHIYDNSAQQSGGGVFITTPDYRIYPDVIIEDNQAPEQPDLAIPSP
jgi:predicted outer membrane repeat protein